MAGPSGMPSDVDSRLEPGAMTPYRQAPRHGSTSRRFGERRWKSPPSSSSSETTDLRKFPRCISRKGEKFRARIRVQGKLYCDPSRATVPDSEKDLLTLRADQPTARKSELPNFGRAVVGGG